MFVDNLRRLTMVFLHTDLQYRLVWKDDRLLAVEVTNCFSNPCAIHDRLPDLSEMQVDAIRNALESRDVNIEHISVTDEIGGLIVDLPALRYTAKK